MLPIYDDQRELILFWSPKCGCTCLKNLYFRVVLKKKWLSPHPMESYGKWNKLKYDKYKKFLLCRNPYSRIVSCFFDQYVYRKASKPYHVKETFKGFVDILYDHFVNHNHNEVVDFHHTAPQFADQYFGDLSFDNWF